MDTMDKIEFIVDINHINKGINVFKDLLSTPEENIPANTPNFYEAVVCYNKINEAESDDDTVVHRRGFHEAGSRYDRHTRYILSQNRKNHNERVSAERKFHQRKIDTGTDGLFIKNGNNITYYSPAKIWGAARKRRRLTKDVRREYELAMVEMMMEGEVM